MAATATTAAAAHDATAGAANVAGVTTATAAHTSTDHPYLVTFIPLGGAAAHTRRVVNLEHPQPIGRLLDKDEASLTTLKFASKVVSRQHAVMGFLDRKLYIQDTKSSSGTFLNSKRLSPQGQESGKVEVRDGDVIRLGEECEVNGVVHQAVTLKVALGNLGNLALRDRHGSTGGARRADDGAEYTENYIDLSTNPQVSAAVDAEFNLIWSSLTRGLDHPLKKLRDAGLSPASSIIPTAATPSQATRTPSSASSTATSKRDANRSSTGSATSTLNTATWSMTTSTAATARRPSATPPRGLVIREGEVWDSSDTTNQNTNATPPPALVVERTVRSETMPTAAGAAQSLATPGVLSPGLRTAVGPDGVFAAEQYIPPASDAPLDELRPQALGTH